MSKFKANKSGSVCKCIQTAKRRKSVPYRQLSNPEVTGRKSPKVADSLLFVMTARKRNCDTPEILSILTSLIAGDETVCIRELAVYVA